MPQISKIIDGDFGGSKLAIGVLPTIRKPNEPSDFCSVAHELGRLLACPNTTVKDAMLSPHMEAVAQWLEAISKPQGEGIVFSNFFVATAPGRSAQEKDPGIFSKMFFEKTGFFPWVISGKLEGIIMAYALRSPASYAWGKLCVLPSLLHIHPGSQSLEMSLSSHGHATHGEKVLHGCEEKLGFLESNFTGKTEKAFHSYRLKLKERLTHSSSLSDIFAHTQCGSYPEHEPPQCVATGKAARKLIGRVLISKGINPKTITKGSERWLENSRLYKEDLESIIPLLIRKLNGETTPSKIPGRKAEVYACAMFLNILEVVSSELSQKGIFVSDARLVYGINELRKMGSNDHYLIPQMSQDMYAEFFGTLMHKSYDAKFVNYTASNLQGILTFLRGEEEGTGINRVVALHALGTSLFERFEGDSFKREKLSAYFGANRFPSEPRVYQEALLGATLHPEKEDASATQRLASGVMSLISHTLTPAHDPKNIEFGVSHHKLSIKVGTTAELHNLEERVSDIKRAAEVIGLEGVEFTLR